MSLCTGFIPRILLGAEQGGERQGKWRRDGEMHNFTGNSALTGIFCPWQNPCQHRECYNGNKYLLSECASQGNAGELWKTQYLFSWLHVLVTVREFELFSIPALLQTHPGTFLELQSIKQEQQGLIWVPGSFSIPLCLWGIYQSLPGIKARLCSGAVAALGGISLCWYRLKIAFPPLPAWHFLPEQHRDIELLPKSVSTAFVGLGEGTAAVPEAPSSARAGSWSFPCAWGLGFHWAAPGGGIHCPTAPGKTPEGILPNRTCRAHGNVKISGITQHLPVL